MVLRRCWVLVFICGVVVDQMLKSWASSALDFISEKVVISGVLSFQLVHNYGAAYGIFQNQKVFLILVSVGFIVFSLVFRRLLVSSVWSEWGIVFIYIGAIGNLWDRVVLGYVVDFINIYILPVFNIADICINIGVGLSPHLDLEFNLYKSLTIKLECAYQIKNYKADQNQTTTTIQDNTLLYKIGFNFKP